MAHEPQPHASERFWADDPAALVRHDRVAHILPRAGEPLVAQLNALMRFALYYGALLLVLQRGQSALYVPLLVAAITFVVWRAEADREGDTRERMDELQLQRDRASGGLRVRPTRDNPFMNVLPTDVGRFPNRPPAADVTDPAVAARVEREFAYDLYRDQNDVFDRATSSRNYYTMPATTIPNDQAGFAEWLYRAPRTCKEGDGHSCWSRTFRNRTA